ncbi:hypothetical protein BaRGS_00027782 [Batillaria attramentaria]|uniref:Uncharacterized protein n=1 Tax=Batillaria attramentaria TaxID=370345 RepID=A0ABD0K0U6_9CAEN
MAESVRRTTSQSPRSSGIVDLAEPPLRIATFNLNSYEEEKNTTPSADVSATLATILSHFDLVLMLERRRPGNDTNIDRLIRRLHTVDRAEPFDFEESQSVCKIHGAEHYCFFYRSSRLSVADVHKFKREESLGRKGGKKRQDEGDSSPDRHAPGASGVATDHDTTKPGVSDMKDGDVPQLPQMQPPSHVACLASTSSLAGSMASTSMAVVPSRRLVPHVSVSPAEGAVTDAPSVATLPSLATSPSQPVSTTHLDVQAKESQGQSSVLVEGGSAQPSPKPSRFAVTKVSHAELSGITEGQSYENDMETLDVTEVTKISQCKLPGMAEGQSSAEGMERNVIQVTKVSPAEPSGVSGRISSENESKGKADVDSSEVFRFDETKVTKSDLFYLNQGQSDEQSLEATDGTDEFPSVVSNSELTEVNISDSTDEKSQEAREGIRVSVSEPPQRKKSEVREVVSVLEARVLSASLSSSGSPQKEERGSLDTATTSTDSEDVYLPDVIHREVLPVAKMGVSAPQPDLVTPEYDFTKSASLPDTGIGQTHPSSRNMSFRTCTLTPVVDRDEGSSQISPLPDSFQAQSSEICKERRDETVESTISPQPHGPEVSKLRDLIEAEERLDEKLEPTSNLQAYVSRMKDIAGADVSRTYQPDISRVKCDDERTTATLEEGPSHKVPVSQTECVESLRSQRCETEAREEKKQALVENIPRLQTDDETESQACKSKDSDVIGDSQISLLADLMSSELDLTSSPSANIIPQAVHSGTEIEDYHHPMVVHRDVLPVARRGHSLHEPQPIVPECDLTRSPSTSMESISEVTRMLQRHHPPKRGSHTPRDGDSLSITEGDSYPREVDAGVVMDTAAPETQEEEPRVDKEGEVNVAHTECFFGPEQDEVTEKETDTEIYVSKDEEVYFPERPHVSHTGRLHGPEQGQVRVTEDAGEKADEVESHALETGKDAVAESETLAVSNKQEQRYVQAIGAGEKPQYHVQVVETERADNSQNDAVMSQKDKVMSQRDEVMSQKDVLMSQKAAVMSRKDVMLQKDEVLSQTDEAKSDTETREEGKPALTVILRQTQCVSGQGKDSDVRAFVHHKLTSDKTLHHTHTSLFKSEEATLQCRSYTERRPETQLRMARKRFETAKVSASQLQLELSLLTEKDMTHSASSGEDGGSRQDIHSDDDEEQTSAHSNLQDNDMVPSVSGKQTIACQTITHKSIGKRLAKSSHITAERSFSYKVTFNNEDATTSRSFENKMSISYSRVGQQGRVSPAASQAAEEKASPSRAVPVVKQYPVGHVSGEDAGPSYQTESGAKQPATLQVNAPERIVSWHDELTPEFQGEASKTKLTDDDHGSIMLIEDVEPGPTPAPVPSREQSKTVLLITPVQSVTHLIASTPKQMSDISIKQQQQTGPSKETSQISLMKSSTALNEDESKVSPEPEPKLITAQSKDSKTTLVKPAQVIYIPPSRGFSRDLMPIVLPPGMSIIVKQKKSPSQEHIETAEIPQTKVFYIPASKTLSREILSIAGVTPEPSESKQRAAASSKENQALTEEESPSSEPIPSKEQSKTSLMSRPIGTPSAASLAPATQSGTAINRVKSETSEILTSDNVRPQTKTCLCCKTVFTDMTSEDDPLSDVDICANCRAVFDQIQSQINQRSKLKLSPPSKTASKVSQLSERQMSGVSINAEPVTTQTAQVNGGIPSQTMTSEIQRVTSQTSNMLQVAPLAETKPCIYCKTDYVVTSTDDGEISEVEMCVTCKIVLDEMQSRINRVPEAQRSPPIKPAPGTIDGEKSEVEVCVTCKIILDEMQSRVNREPKTSYAIKPAPGTSMSLQDRTTPSREQSMGNQILSQLKWSLPPSTVSRKTQSMSNQMSSVFDIMQMPEARTCHFCKTEFTVTPSDDGEISEAEICVTCKIILDEMQSRVNQVPEPKANSPNKFVSGISMSVMDRPATSREPSTGSQILQFKKSLPPSTSSRETQPMASQKSNTPGAKPCIYCKTDNTVKPSDKVRTMPDICKASADDGEIPEVKMCVTCKTVLDKMQSRFTPAPVFKTSPSNRPASGISVTLQDSREQPNSQMARLTSAVPYKIPTIRDNSGPSQIMQWRTSPFADRGLSVTESTSIQVIEQDDNTSYGSSVYVAPITKPCIYCKTEFVVKLSADDDEPEVGLCAACQRVLDEMRPRPNLVSRVTRTPQYQTVSYETQVSEPAARTPIRTQARGQQTKASQSFSYRALSGGLQSAVSQKSDEAANLSCELVVKGTQSTGVQASEDQGGSPNRTVVCENVSQQSQVPEPKTCVYCKTEFTEKLGEDGRVSEIEICFRCRTVFNEVRSRTAQHPITFEKVSRGSQASDLNVGPPVKAQPRALPRGQQSSAVQTYTMEVSRDSLSTVCQIIRENLPEVSQIPETKACVCCKTVFTVNRSEDGQVSEVEMCVTCKKTFDTLRFPANQGSALRMECPSTSGHQPNTSQTSAMQVSPGSLSAPCTITSETRTEIIQTPEAKTCHCCNTVFTVTQSEGGEVSEIEMCVTCKTTFDKLRFPANQGSAVRRECPSASGYQPKSSQGSGMYVSRGVLSAPCKAIPENRAEVRQIPATKTCVCCKTVFTETWCEDGDVSEVEMCVTCKTTFHELRSRASPSKSDRQLKANEMPYSDRVYAEMYTDERGFDTDRMRSGISNVLQDAGGVRVVRYQQTSQSPEIDRNRQYRSAYSGHLPTTSVPSGAVTRGQYSQGSQPVRQAEVIIERDDAQALLYAAAMVTVNALSEARKEVRIQGDREKAPKPQRGLRTMTNKGAKHWDGYTDEAGFDPDLTRESWTCITSTDDDKDKAKTPSAKPDRTDSVPAYVFDDAGFDPEKMRTLSSTEVIEEITPASAARMDSVIVVVSETSVFDPQRRQTIKMTQTCHYKTPSPRPEPLDRRSRTDVRERVRDRDRERDREGVSEPARKSGDEEARPAVGALLLKDEVPTEEYKESAGIDPEGIRSSFTDVPDMRYSEGTWSEVEYGEYESPFDEMVPQEEYDTSLPEVELSDHISSGSSDATPESPETDILEYETGVLEYETGIPEFEHTVAVQTDSPWTESSPSDEEDGPMRRFSSSVDWHFSEKPESDTRAPRLSKPIEGMFGTKSSAPDEWQSTTEESVYFIISPIRHTQATGVSSTAGRQQAIEHPSTVFWQEAARASSAVNQQQVRKPSSAVAQQQVRKPSSAVDQQQVRKPSSAVDQQQVRKPSSAVDQQEVRKPSSAVDWKQATLSGVWQQRTGPPTGAHWQEPIRSPAGTHWQQATGPPSGVQWQQASGPPTGAQWQQATVPPPGVHWQQATGPPPGAQWQQAAGPPPGAQWQQTTGPPPGAQWQQATGLQWQQATGPPTGAQWQQATVPPPGAHWQQATGPPPGAYWQQATGPPPGAHWQQATGPPPGVHWQQETQPPSGVWQQTTGSTTAVNQQHKPKTSAVSFQRASGSQSGFSRQKTSRSPSTVHRQQASRSPSTVSQQRERKSAADWHHPIRPSSAVDRHQFYPTRQSSAVDWIHTTRGSSAVDWHHPIIAARTSSAVDWKHTRRPSSAVDWLYSMRPSSAVDWLHSPRRSSFADWLLSPGTSNTTDWFYSGESPDRSFRRASRVPARQDPQYRSDVGPDRDARLARRVSSRPEYRTDDGPERDSRQFSRVSRSTRRESQAEGSSRARRLSSPTDWQDTPDYIVLPEIPVETQSVGTSPHLPPTRSTSTETEFQASKSVITERAPTKTTATEKKLYTSKSVSCVQDSLPVKFFADQPPKSVIMVSKSAACVEAPEEWQPEKVTASVSSEAMLQEEKAANTINKRPVVKTTGTATNLQATKSISTVVARDLGSVDPYDPWGECDTADGEILGRLSSPVDYKHSSAVDWQHSSDFVLLGPESDKFTPPIDSSVDYECVPDFFVPQKTRRRSSTADLEFYAPGDHIIQNREAKERQRKESSSADAGYVSDNIMMRSTMPYRPPSSVDLDYKSDFIMFPSKYKHMPRTSTMADETRSDFVIMPTRYTDGSTHDIYLPALPSKVMSQVDTEYKSAYITLTPKTKLDTSQYPVTVREAGTTNEDDGQAKKPVLVSAQGKAAPVSTPLPVSAKAAHTRAPTTSAHRVSFSERREYSQDPRCSTSKDEKIIEPRMGMNFKTHTSYTRDENQEDDDTEEGPGPAKLPWDNEFLRSVATTTRLPQAISTFSQTLQTIAMVSKSVACMDTDSLYKADADTEGAPRVVITSPEFAPRSIGVGTDVMLDAGPSTAVATNIQIARSLAAATEENDQEGAPAEFPILIVKSPGEATYESVGVEAHIKMGRTYATQTGWEPCFKDQWQNTELVYQDLDQFRIMPGDFAMNSVATMTDKAIMSSVGVTADLPEKFSASVDTYKPNAVFRELYELVGYLDLGPDWKHLCTTGIQTDTIKEEAETQTSNRKKRKPPPGCFDAMKIAAPWIPPEPEDSRESTISLTGKIVHATARRQSFLDHLRPGRGQRENSSNEYYTEYDRKRSAAIGIPGTAYGKPGTAHGKPSTAYGKPGTAHGKPSTDYGKPGTAHGKPGTAHGKPGTAYGPSTSHRRSAGANRNSNPNANPDRGVEPESKSRWRDAKSPGENVNPNANPGVVIIKAPKTTSRSVNTPPTTSRDMATETAIVVVKSPYQPMTESIGTETNIQIARTCGTETDDDQEAKSDFPVIIVQSPGDGNFQSIGVEADIKLARTLATQTGEDVSTKNFGVNTDITVQYPDFIKPIPPDFEEKEEGTQTRFLLSSSVAVQVAMSEAPEKDQCMIPFESCGAKEPEPPSDEDMEISGRLVEPRPYTMWGREERSENSGSYSEQEETRRSHARENTSPNANPGREKRVKTLAFRRSVSSNQGDSSNNKGEDGSSTPQEGCTHDKTHSCQHKEQGEATEQDRPRDTIDDKGDLMHVFLCEPFAVRFASPTTAVTDFAVLAVHTDPRDAKLEVCGIQHLYNATRTRWWLEDMLIAGDFTMVDSYDEMEDWLPIEHRSDRRFTRLVENEDVDEPTNTGGEASCEILHPGKFWSLQAEEVSDHYPLQIKIAGAAIYNRWHMNIATHAGVVIEQTKPILDVSHIRRIYNVTSGSHDAAFFHTVLLHDDSSMREVQARRDNVMDVVQCLRDFQTAFPGVIWDSTVSMAGAFVASRWMTTSPVAGLASYLRAYLDLRFSVTITVSLHEPYLCHVTITRQIPKSTAQEVGGIHQTPGTSLTPQISPRTQRDQSIVKSSCYTEQLGIVKSSCYTEQLGIVKSSCYTERLGIVKSSCYTERLGIVKSSCYTERLGIVKSSCYTEQLGIVKSSCYTEQLGIVKSSCYTEQLDIVKSSCYTEQLGIVKSSCYTEQLDIVKSSCYTEQLGIVKSSCYTEQLDIVKSSCYTEQLGIVKSSCYTEQLDIVKSSCYTEQLGIVKSSCYTEQLDIVKSSCYTEQLGIVKSSCYTEQLGIVKYSCYTEQLGIVKYSCYTEQLDIVKYSCYTEQLGIVKYSCYTEQLGIVKYSCYTEQLGIVKSSCYTEQLGIVKSSCYTEQLGIVKSSCYTEQLDIVKSSCYTEQLGIVKSSCYTEQLGIVKSSCYTEQLGIVKSSCYTEQLGIVKSSCYTEQLGIVKSSCYTEQLGIVKSSCYTEQLGIVKSSCYTEQLGIVKSSCYTEQLDIVKSSCYTEQLGIVKYSCYTEQLDIVKYSCYTEQLGIVKYT